MAGRPPRGGHHETFDELAVGWALHALEPEDEAVFTRHLLDCARCARTVAETSEVMGALALDLPQAEPSDELRERLRAAVRDTEQVHRPVLPPDQPTDLLEEPDDALRPLRADAPRPSAPAHGPSGPGRVRPWRPAAVRGTGRHRGLPYALAAAAVAAILGLASWDVVLNSSRQQAQTTLAQQSHMISSLLAPGQATIAPVSDSGGHGVATVVARHGQVQVVTWGLSVNNRSATTYVVWGMREGSPVALGTFDVVRPGTDLRTVGSDHTGLDNYSGYAISIEPGRKAPSKPTDIVANGQVTS